MKTAVKILISILSFFAVVVLVTQPGTQPASANIPETAVPLQQDFITGQAVSYELSPAVRDLEPERDGATLDREINPRHNPLAFEPDMGQRGTWDRDNVPTDPLIANSQNASSQTPGLDFSFEGTGNPTGCGGCSPPDTVGDVGLNHYIHMVNATKVAIFDKAGTSLNTPFDLGTLWSSGNCTSNAGDPIPLYDSLADRWLLSQFAGPSHMCIAISQTADPLGSYHLYTFNVGSFPDYFKFGVWPDAYYMSANEASYTAYAFDRAKMLVGDVTATFQKFTGQDNLLLPADIDGPTLPPAGDPGYFYTFKDDSFHGGADRIELFALDVDWVTPANSTFGLIETIPVAAFTYTACGFFNFNCLMQPGTAQTVDAISEWPMFRFPYRNFGSHQTLIGNFTIGGGTGEVGAAIRWFELRDTGSGWTLYQEGTQDPGDGHDRAVGSIAMDKNGNIALGYTVSSSSLFPSIHYATRLATDSLGTLQTEAILIAGTGSQTGSNRWGDYSAMGIDPANDCSFWYTNEYYPVTASTTWKTRVGVFTIPECLSADFTITAAPPSQQICAPNPAIYTVNIGSTSAANPIVNLSASGHPAGTTATFSVNNQPAPYTSTLTISDTIAAAPGTYAIDIVGTGPTSTHTTTVQLDLFAGAPAAPALVTPANGASGVSSSPTFEWSAVADASSYTLEVATDPAFSTIVYTATVAAPATSHTAGITLSANTLFYWRVTANNPCGAGPASTTFSFLTANTFCSTPGLPINAGPHTDDLTISATGLISDINVSLDISHSWVGDLIVSLEHVDTGTSLTLVDRPGLPSPNPTDGCNDNDLVDFILDDESANGPHDDACPNTDATPAYPTGSDWDPIQASLALFDGETISGTWRLSITDAFTAADNGVLNEWCIIPELPGTPEILADPTSLSSTQPPDTILTHTLTISNVGTGTLNWNVVEQNESTFLETITVADYPETAESAANLTPSMQAFLQDKEPAQNLPPQGATACVGNMAGSYPCGNIDLLSFLPLGSIGGGEGNDIWGWTGCNGREFALMGRTSGTAFVEITDPVNPVYLGNLPTHTGNSIWRDIKTYADHAFIVSEASGHGMQVFDLTQLCTITAPPVTFSETTHYNGFGNAHNLAINEDSGYAYSVGTNTCSGGLHMVNIQNPLSPTSAGCYSADGYTHDTQCVNYHGPDTEHQGKEICFNSQGSTETLTIVDVTNKAAPIQLSNPGYTGSAYTHQGWLTEDHTYFLLDDEADETTSGHNTRTYIWDLTDLDNPQFIDNYTASTAAIDHNLYLKGNYAFEANYRAGLRILDIHDIANGNLFEEAYFDIYPTSDSANFNGAWSNYPYFDSGVVVLSGIEQGLFVLQPTTLPGTCTSPSDIPWLTVSPTSGSTAANGGTPVNVIFDSTGLALGEYTASLCIESNAVTTPQLQVPVTLTVSPNQVPVAMDDDYTTTQNMALTVAAPGVLSNDTDGDGQPLTAVLDTGPVSGTLTLNADGSFTYTPTLGFEGSDSFTYRATDGINSSNIATVTITVTAPVGDIQLYLPFVANDD
jgi:choice-of-anchor B domain-containing protein